MKADKLLLLSVLVGICLAIISSAPLIALPYQVDYGEGLMLEGAQCIRHAQPLYPNPFAFPIVLHVYGPVAYAAVASVLHGDTPSFPAGRVLILACSIAISLLLSSILRRMTGSWYIALAFGLLLLTLPAFRFWLYLVRADAIGVLFSIIGVALYLWKSKLWFCSIPFFGLAIFCKYTLIAPPLAVLAHLILNRQGKRGLGFAMALGLLCSLAFAVLQVTTGGWFAFHMFSTHPDRYSLAQFVALGALVWGSAPVVTVLAMWYAAHDFRGRSWTFPSSYFVMSLVTAFSAGKLGSTTNRFLEWMVASCMCAGLGYSVLMRKYASKVVPATVLLSVSLLAGAIVQSRTSQPSHEFVECRKAYHYVSDSSSTVVFSENLGPLLVSRKPILVSDPFVYSQMVKHSGSDQKVEQLLRQRYFGLIVLENDPSPTKPRGSDLLPDSIVDAIDQNYQTIVTLDCRGAGVMLGPNPSSRAQP